MSRAFVAGALLFFFSRLAMANPRIAFERGNSIWVANVDGSGPRKICKGSASSFSPDGSRIAFHTDTSTPKEVIRQIAVADVASKHVTVFKEGIPGRNCQHAVWSPDGAHILFNIFGGSDWHLAMINSDGSGFRYIRKSALGQFSVWSQCWARDSRSIYCQDLDHLYQFDLDGVELKKWRISSLFSKGGFSSATHLSVSPDGHTLVMDVEMQEETASNILQEDGPPGPIWTFDTSAEKTSRLTPQGLSAWHPCWFNEKAILFCTQQRKEKTSCIDKLLIGREQPARLIPNANNQSVSR